MVLHERSFSERYTNVSQLPFPEKALAFDVDALYAG